MTKQTEVIVVFNDEVTLQEMDEMYQRGYTATIAGDMVVFSRWCSKLA